jgi:hypothetical protein
VYDLTTFFNQGYWKHRLSQQFSKCLFLYDPQPLHVSALTGHPQEEYTLDCWKLLHPQRVRCSAGFIYRKVTIFTICILANPAVVKFESACKMCLRCRKNKSSTPIYFFCNTLYFNSNIFNMFKIKSIGRSKRHSLTSEKLSCRKT